MRDKPVVLPEPTGHFDGLLGWLGAMVDTGFVAQRALDGLAVTTDLADALDRCAAPYAAV